MSHQPKYGDRTYWNERYIASSNNPFDWLCDFDQLKPTLEQLLPRKDGLTLVVGCGDAPFSPDLYFRGNYKRTIHIDYSDVVVERMRGKYPEMDFREMDALSMPFQDGTFDAIIDKSLIDTTLCYQDGHGVTTRLFAELRRVLKPGGRLLTISLHSEDEVVRYRFSPAVSHCRLRNHRCENKKADLEEENGGGGGGGDSNGKKKSQFHTLVVFDKLDGTSIDEQIAILDMHPIDIVGAAPRADEEEDEAVGVAEAESAAWKSPLPSPSSPPPSELDSAENIRKLMATVDTVLEDLMELHEKARALAEQRASEEKALEEAEVEVREAQQEALEVEEALEAEALEERERWQQT